VEREQEQRCLFYVGVTRARDLVVFTYGGAKKRKQPEGVQSEPIIVDPSPMLDLLRDDPSYQHAPFLLDADQLARLEERAATLRATLAATQGLPDEDDDATADEAVDDAIDAVASAPTSGVKPEHTFHDLESYLTCPRQYRYAAQYHLLGAAEQATLRFHRYVRAGLAGLDDLYARRPQATAAEVGALLDARWQSDGLAGLPHEQVYRRYGEDVLRQQWQTLTADAQAPRRAAAKQTLQAELRQCVVSVTADYLIEDVDGAGQGASGEATAPGRRRIILERLHTRGHNAQDPEKLDLLLYYLAFQRLPEVDLRIMIRYLGASLADVDTMSGQADADQPNADRAILTDAAEHSSVVDVTAKIAHDALQYLNPTRKRRSRLDKLDDAARGIAAGRFAPRPNAERCAACAFHNVCPADPELD
jgi:hypothetical protein